MSVFATTALALVAASSAAETPFSWSRVGHVVEEAVSQHKGYPRTLKSATYTSQAFALRPGEFLYTEDQDTPLEFPQGRPYAITGFSGEIVDGDTLESTPLSEVYDHHWVVTHTGFSNLLCRDGPTYAFGIGAESRNTPVAFPEGFGFKVMDPSLYWGGNIHLLRTEYLDGEDPARAAKECAECWYAPGKGCGPWQNGTFSCCGDSDVAKAVYGKNVSGGPFGLIDQYARCPTRPDAPRDDSKTYRLKYTINYTEHVDAIEEAHVGVWTTPDCNTYYNAERNNDAPEHLSSTEFTVPHDAEILVAIGHQHIGSLNMSLFVNGDFVCASLPTYGSTPGKAGDELGYLVAMSTCFEKDQDPRRPSLVLKANDTVRLDSWYWVGDEDARIAPTPGGAHLNVMGYIYTVYRLL